MPNPKDVKRIAKATAAFYGDHAGKSLRSFVEEHWRPDIIIHQFGREPYGMEQFLAEHSPDTGMSWDDTHMEVKKLVIGEDGFVLHANLINWRTHEADAIEKSGEDRKPGLEGYQTEPIPVINFCTVGESGKVERIDSFVFVKPELVARGAVTL